MAKTGARSLPRASGSASAIQAMPVPWVPLLLIGLLLAIGPLFRGLYFQYDQLWAAVVVVFAAAWIMMRRSSTSRWFRGPMDYALVAWLASYTLSFAFAANYRMALQAVIVDGTGLLIYWCAGELTARWRVIADYLVVAIVIGGALSAFVGLASAVGLMNFPGAFVHGRVYTSFQYPDAAAAFLMACFLLTGFPLEARSRFSRWWTAVASAVGVVLFSTFLLAASRGAELVLPIALLVLFLLLPRGVRTRVALRFLATAVIATGAVLAGRHAFTVRSPLLLILILAGAVVAGVIMDVFSHWDVSRMTKRRWLFPTFGAATIAGASAIIVLSRRVGSLSRLTHLSPSGYDAWSRLQWTRDAMHIFALHPLVGLGGGGWASVYQAFQSYPYNSTQAHDFIAQTLVETGIIGGLALLAVVISFLGAIRRLLQHTPATVDRVAAAVFLGAISMIVLHSVIDFTMSLAAIMFAVSALLGILRGHAYGRPQGSLPASRRRRFVQASGNYRTSLTAAIGLVVIAGLVSLLVGASYGARAVALVKRHNFQAAIPLYRDAIATDPLTSSYRADLAQLDMLRTSSTHDQSTRTKQAIGLLRSAVRLDRYNAIIWQVYARALLENGQLNQAFAAADNAIRSTPMRMQNVATFLQTAVDISVSQYARGQTADAAKVAAAARRRWMSTLAEARRIPAPAVAAGYALKVNDPGVQLPAAESLVLTGSLKRGLDELVHVNAKNGSPQWGEALLWAGIVSRQLGRGQDANRYLAQSRRLLGNGEFQAQEQVVSQAVSHA